MIIVIVPNVIETTLLILNFLSVLIHKNQTVIQIIHLHHHHLYNFHNLYKVGVLAIVSKF